MDNGHLGTVPERALSQKETYEVGVEDLKYERYLRNNYFELSRK